MRKLIARLQNEIYKYSETEHLIDTVAIISRPTYLHCLRVMGYSALVCALDDDLPEYYKRDIVVSALLHDVGKVKINPVIRKATVLDEDDWQKIRQHPELGYLLCAGRFSEIVLNGIKYHHERLDGSGYGTGISGEQVPIEARIIAVCDAFDAMTSNRLYKESVKREEAFLQLDNEVAQGKYDGRYVEMLKDVVYNHDIVSMDTIPIARNKIFVPEGEEFSIEKIILATMLKCV